MKHLQSIALVLLLATLSGCDRGFESLNVNPNIPESTDPAYLMAYAQHRYFTDYSHGVLTEAWALNIWLQVQADMNGIASVDDAYFIGGDALDNTWRVFYAEVLGNLDAAERLAAENGQDQQVAAIAVFQAAVMQQVTDLWGAVPFTEAFGAQSPDGNPNFTPSYDDQRTIYLALLDELSSAAAVLDGNSDVFGSQDWLCGGNATGWRQLAHALTLRMCIRMSAVEPALAQSLSSEVLAANDFPSADISFAHSSFARSPFFELHNTGQGMRSPSAFMLDLLKSTDDPRVEVVAELAPQSIILGNPDYIGVPNFLLASEVDPDEINAFTTSYIGTAFQQESTETPLVSAAEVQFLLAEAALLGWNTPLSAQAHFEAGVAAHMASWGISSEATSAYLAAHPFDGTVEHIGVEKWKTFIYTNPIEQFAEYRRLGVPVLTDAAGAAIDPAQVPKRLAYPNSEISLNGAQVSAVGEGINDFFSPVWWDTP